MTRSILCLLALAALTACDPTTSPANGKPKVDKPESVETSYFYGGYVRISGPVSNATVCIDENANLHCDEGEESTVSLSDGSYSFEFDKPLANQTLLVAELKDAHDALIGNMTEAKFPLVGFANEHADISIYSSIYYAHGKYFGVYHWPWFVRDINTAFFLNEFDIASYSSNTPSLKSTDLAALLTLALIDGEPENDELSPENYTETFLATTFGLLSSRSYLLTPLILSSPFTEASLRKELQNVRTPGNYKNLWQFPFTPIASFQNTNQLTPKASSHSIEDQFYRISSISVDENGQLTFGVKRLLQGKFEYLECTYLPSNRLLENCVDPWADEIDTPSSYLNEWVFIDDNDKLQRIEYNNSDKRLINIKNDTLHWQYTYYVGTQFVATYTEVEDVIIREFDLSGSKLSETIKHIDGRRGFKIGEQTYPAGSKFITYDSPLFKGNTETFFNEGAALTNLGTQIHDRIQNIGINTIDDFIIKSDQYYMSSIDYYVEGHWVYWNLSSTDPTQLTGISKFYAIPHEETTLENAKVLGEISWERKSFYGRDAIVLDPEKVGLFEFEVSVIYELDGRLEVKNIGTGGNYNHGESDIYFNETAFEFIANQVIDAYTKNLN